MHHPFETLPFLESSHDGEGESDTEGDSVDEELAGLFNAGSEDVLISSTKSHNIELNSLLSGIGNVIDCLLRLSVTISNPAPHDHFRSRAGVELDPFFEHYDTQHVREKYPNIQPKLSERLGRMLANRRRYIRYRVDHHSRLMQGLEGTVDDGATTIASSLPQALKDGHQVHLNVEDDDRSEISATSYASSTTDQSELRVPPIPKAYVDGPFLCPFCYVIIPVDTRHDWKKHVFRDLRPYACLVETCLVDQDFPRRKDWILHMQEEHWRAWSCPFGCVGEYQSISGLRKHFHRSHKAEVMEQDVEAIINLSSKADLSCAEGPCPLCHDPIKSSRQYQSHVGHHLEQLALFVLPTQEDDHKDQEHSDHDDKSDNSQDADDEARMEEMKAQLKLLQDERRQQEEVKKRADTEQKIREDAERAFKIRKVEMEIAQEQAKREIELAKIAYERAARERFEEEREANQKKLFEEEYVNWEEKDFRDKIAADKKTNEENSRRMAEEASRLRHENEMRILLERERLLKEEFKEEEDAKKDKEEFLKKIEEETRARSWAESVDQRQIADQPVQDASDANSRETT